MYLLKIKYLNLITMIKRRMLIYVIKNKININKNKIL